MVYVWIKNSLVSNVSTDFYQAQQLGLPDTGMKGDIVKEARVHETHRQIRHTAQLHTAVCTHYNNNQKNKIFAL
jgi:hypothetical protein